MALKKPSLAEFLDRPEKSVVLRQLFGQGGCGGAGRFRRGGVDDREDRLRALRKADS